MRSERTGTLASKRIALGALSIVAGIVVAGCGDRGGTSTELAKVNTVKPAEASPVVVPPPAPPAPPSPAEVKAAWQEGVTLFDRGEYPNAVERLRVAIVGRPDDAYAHYLLGLALFKSGEHELAEESLTRSSELNADSIRTWINLARVRMERDDAEGALHAAETALTIEPRNASALHQRGRAEAALGRDGDAVETLKLAHDADPENGYIANTLGYELIRTGHPDEAVSLLELAKEKLPTTAYVRNNLGVAYERTGKLAEAMVEYRAAVEAGDPLGKAASSVARLTPLVEGTVAESPVTEGQEVAVKSPEDPEKDPR